MTVADRIATNMARSQIHRYLADAFDYPDAELAESVRSGRLQQGIAGAAAQLPEIKGEDPAAEAACLEAVAWLTSHAGEITLDRLDTEYGAVFGHALSRDCPQYETEYVGEHIFYQSQELADISGFYRAYELDVSETAHERLDHVSVELEWMHVVAAREAYALQEGKSEQAEVCRDSQRQFVEAHIGRWGSYFARLVASAAPDTVYRRFADVLQWFLEYETRSLNASPEQVVAIRPVETFDEEAEAARAPGSDVQWVGDMTR
ncbi:hypothetical protein FJZ36_04990 [Candidatus Poribacteria bacterium]|nr:hypothetical protein [Candidatus Poribacteria bacterium]